MNEQPAKPARAIAVGNLLGIKNDSGEFQVEVLSLSEVRGPASAAQQLYRESEESREARAKAAEERKLMPRAEPAHGGKLSKRERRKIDQFRGRV